MKTFKHLYEQITSFDNLYQAFRLARRGKRGRAAVAGFELNLESALLELQADLRSQTYAPGQYHNFYIYEPKRRLVSAAPFRDRVVHHALCRVIEPIWEARFIHHSYACRVGKGTHAALDQCQAWLRRHAYVFHGDIVKYFPSIDHQILYELVRRKIADPQTLWLIQTILDSGAGVQADERPELYFPGDDLFAALRPTGLPIGNLTSQFWANVYLHELDQFVKQELSCQAYLRYMDDVRRRETAYEETQRRVNVREKRFKAPTLSRPGNRLGSVAWWERPEFCNPRQTTEGQARLDMARAKLPKDQFRAVIA